MDRSTIHIVYEYVFCRGTSTSETAGNINKVFGEDVTNERTVCQWFQKFRSGDFTLENQPRGRPQTKVDNDELQTVVEMDTSQTTHSNSHCSQPSVFLSPVKELESLDLQPRYS
ncbi:histone-lysine N-methyltransferase SETMAR-like [Octopus sinensis]|uniref:Histone-lysine N-methyltransferase SETMAR-like n=1 Tax=Octopus sinensis TaxID=2607531 RepID=A0A7E6F289_9MOLL|nr:histone-lysine N-methyltransferase SETMAR-like [Octopus sinensis]